MSVRISKTIAVPWGIDEQTLRKHIDSRVQELYREKMRTEGSPPYPPRDHEVRVSRFDIEVLFYPPVEEMTDLEISNAIEDNPPRLPPGHMLDMWP